MRSRTARGQDGGADALVLDVGELEINSVRLGRARLPFVVEEHRLTARLRDGLPSGRSLEIEVAYHGQPKRGLRFFPERQQAYTVENDSMLDFLEERAGVRIPGASYSQVLLGDFFQKWVYSTEGGPSVAP